MLYLKERIFALHSMGRSVTEPSTRHRAYQQTSFSNLEYLPHSIQIHPTNLPYTAHVSSYLLRLWSPTPATPSTSQSAYADHHHPKPTPRSTWSTATNSHGHQPLTTRVNQNSNIDMLTATWHVRLSDLRIPIQTTLPMAGLLNRSTTSSPLNRHIFNTETFVNTPILVEASAKQSTTRFLHWNAPICGPTYRTYSPLERSALDVPSTPAGSHV